MVLLVEHLDSSHLLHSIAKFANQPPPISSTFSYLWKHTAGTRTTYDKVWDEHVVPHREDGTSVLYIDRHLVHEVTSPPGFEACARSQAQGVAREFGGRHRRPQHAHHRLEWAMTASPIPYQQTDHHWINIKELVAAFFPFLPSARASIHVIGPEERSHPGA